MGDEEEQIDMSLVLNRTPEDIQQEIGDMVLANPRIENPVEVCEKLLGQYIVVQELYQISCSRYVRWINPETGKLSCGGIVLGIHFRQGKIPDDSTEPESIPRKTGVFIVCRGYSGGIFNIQYDNTLFFQKLKPREILFLDLLGSVNTQGKLK